MRKAIHKGQKLNAPVSSGTSATTQNTIRIEPVEKNPTATKAAVAKNLMHRSIEPTFFISTSSI